MYRNLWDRTTTAMYCQRNMTAQKIKKIQYSWIKEQGNVGVCSSMWGSYFMHMKDTLIREYKIYVQEDHLTGLYLERL